MMNKTEMYSAIRRLRPDISPLDALSIVRLPFDRARELYQLGKLSRSNVRTTVRILRFLGETR